MVLGSLVGDPTAHSSFRTGLHHVGLLCALLWAAAALLTVLTVARQQSEGHLGTLTRRFPEVGYGLMWQKLTAAQADAGLETAWPTAKVLRDLRRRVGPASVCSKSWPVSRPSRARPA